ncbi:MAG: leucine-rich repeat protein [Alphaproteobacteria bacterium]|nr:leucine-rich repeat protein [Alphaproteobacteria bacterium]
MKKFTLIWMIGLLPIFSLNAATTTYKCGENCTATLDENGVLRVSGTGKMNDYLNNREESPFYNNLAIKKIIVEEGITHIGQDIFCGCENLKHVELANSVQKVGLYAFENIPNIQSITMSDTTVWSSQDEMNGYERSNVIKVYCRGDLEKCTTNLSKNQPANLFKGAKSVYKGKRIYTIEEANQVSGKQNTFMIRYK